ncbi:hypothetical protein [Acidiplasma aeolicum]|jgi:hypothetical protein|uniref:hypothetical protein n=1 Tax=Acidiplasma aeolicum TaxID=507754 RepID=UPI0037249CE5
MVGEREKILYKGSLEEKFWENMNLREKYKNCTDFINEIVHGYEHLKSMSNWDKEHWKENDNEFTVWLTNELKDPELRQCYEKSENKKLKEVKELLKGRL